MSHNLLCPDGKFDKEDGDMSLEEALLAEFDDNNNRIHTLQHPPSTNINIDVQSRMRTIFTEVSDPANEPTPATNRNTDYNPSGMTSLVKGSSRASHPLRIPPLQPKPSGITPFMQGFSIRTPSPKPTTKCHSNYSTQPPYTPADSHVRLPAATPVSNLVYPITTGRNMLALFCRETTPRTRHCMVVEDRNALGQIATAILDARLTLVEICTHYPAFVRGSLLRVFSCEGWTPQLIWNHLPAEFRDMQTRTTSDAMPWAYLDEGLDREMELMLMSDAVDDAEAQAQAVGESGGRGRGLFDIVEEGDEEVSPTAESRPCQVKNRRNPNWTEHETKLMLHMRDVEKKTHQEVATALGRTRGACNSRYAKVKGDMAAAKAKAEAEAMTRTVAEGEHHGAAAAHGSTAFMRQASVVDQEAQAQICVPAQGFQTQFPMAARANRQVATAAQPNQAALMTPQPTQPAPTTTMQTPAIPNNNENADDAMDVDQDVSYEVPDS